MKKIFNGLFYVLKFLLLIVAFGISIFILIRMNIRLEKDITTIIPILLPFLFVFILFIVNMIFKQVGITKNIFYNLTCCLVLITIIFVGYRSIFDTNMVLNQRYGYGIDFNFFDNFIAYMNIMLYGLVLSNILFMFREKNDNEEKSKKLKKA